MKRHVAGAVTTLVSAARKEVSVVAALCAMAGGLFLSIHLAEETGEGDTHAFDMAVLSRLRRPDAPAVPIGPHWLTTSARDLTSLGSTTILVFLGLSAIGFLMMQGRRAAALLVLGSVGGALALSNGLKLVFQRARPDAAFRAIEATQFSFPSGHALISTAVYLTLGALIAHAIRERSLKLYVQLLAVLLVFAIGLSRIYLGVHWTTDVLAGWGMGAAWAMALWLITWWIERRSRLALGEAAP